MPDYHASLLRLIDFYTTLSPAAVRDLSAHYQANAWFKDPFNEVQGVPAIQGIFSHMFEALEHSDASSPPQERLRRVSNTVHLLCTLHDAYLDMGLPYLGESVLARAQGLPAKAEALERDGYADIISKDGKPYTWAACCNGVHDHG